MKKITALVTALGMALSMAACGGSSANAPVSTAEPTTEGTTAQETTAPATTAPATTVAPTTEAETVPAPEPEPVPEGPRPAVMISDRYRYDTEGEFYNQMNVAYQLVFPGKDESSVHAQLAEALNNRAAELEKYYNNQFERWIDAAREYNADATSETNVEEFYIDERAIVRRADSRVLSILEQEQGWLGEEGSFINYRAFNYDVASGAKLTLDDVVADREAFANAIADQLAAQGLDREECLEEIREEMEEGEELAWTLDLQGVTVWFDAGDVSDEEHGSFSATVLFAAQAVPMTGRYTAAAGTQTTMVPVGVRTTFDRGNDGQAEALTIEAVKGDGYLEDITIYTGEESYTEREMMSYNATPYLMVTKGGKAVLYVEYSFDNDGREICVYDLNGSAPARVRQLPESFETDYTEEASYWIPFTNPEQYTLYARMDLLSTVDGYRPFHTDEDGMPVAETEVYTFDNELTIYAKKTVTVDLVSKETGEVTRKDIEVPYGESLKLMRSDNKTYVDCQILSGNMVRVYVDNSSWPITVNGKDIYELFEGMIFAG